MAHPRALERAKSFFFSHFERIFVVLLFASMLIIHYFVDEKLAFLSFYYLPMLETVTPSVETPSRLGKTCNLPRCAPL